MGFTAAERQRKRREKLKQAGQYEEYKKERREGMKKFRQKRKAEEQKLPKKEQLKRLKEKREKTRKAVAEWRRRKATSKEVDLLETTNSPAYKNASALGKAAARAKRALPSTPKRSTAVVKKLFVDFACDITEPAGSSDSARKPNPKTIPGEHLKAVECFYKRDDISRQAPGRKDVVTVKEGNNKRKLQARHLMFSVIEAHALFLQEHPDIKIGKSKFAQLRPRDVLLSSKLPHNVCLCKEHENFIEALRSLHDSCKTIPAYSYEFPSLIVCKDPTRNCWLNQCETCKDGKGFYNTFISEEIDD